MSESRQQKLDRVDQKVLADIEKYGWSDISVFPVKADDPVAFNYTVGFWGREHPEVVMLGLPHELMHGVLGVVYNQVKAGTRFNPDMFYSFVLSGYKCAFVEVVNVVEDTDYPLSMAVHLEGDIKAVQLVWPDQDGRFPWDKAWDPKMKQPLLGPWRGGDS